MANEDLKSTAQYIARQILDQQTTKYWTGEGFGSYDANAEAIGYMLANAGIKDIRQFGAKSGPVMEQVYEPYRILNGTAVYNESSTGEDGTVYNNYVRYDPEIGKIALSKEEWDSATPVYVQYGDDSGKTIDPAKVVIGEDGIPRFDNGRKRTVFYNKDTGKELSTTVGVEPSRGLEYIGNDPYAGDKSTDPNAALLFGKTYSGKGQTNVGVQFAADGTPYFFTAYGGSTSDMNTYAPLVAFALTASGAGAALGGAITSGLGVTTAAGFSAGTVAAASAAAGGALVGGTLAELSGGSFVKGAITGAVTSGVSDTFSTNIGEMLGLQGKMATQVGSAILSGAKAEISGGDFLKGAAMDGLVSTISNTTGFTTKDVKSAISAVAALDSGDPMRIAASLANLTKLDYFNKDKADELVKKVSAPTQEQIDIDRGISGVLAGATVGATLNAKDQSTALPNITGATGTSVAPTGGLSSYGKDIYADAPIKGFAMRKYQDDAGNTKYIPFVGEEAQLSVPTGYKFVGYNKGGFVQKRS